MRKSIDRRTLLRGGLALGGTVALGPCMPAWAQAASSGVAAASSTLSGEDIELRIGHQHMMIDGKPYHAIGINGSAPAPLIRLREGQRVRIHVVNQLDEPGSIHWHGLLVPFQMDGVPGVAFPGIPAGGRFTYEFDVVQSGTYWYHSHSGMQEQEGLYGPIVIDPKAPDPVASDREHVVVLSDHSVLHPHAIMTKLKAQSGYFNRQQQTLAGLLAGRDQSLGQRLAWGRMRMDPTDIADVTGSIYTYLVNGHGPADNWTALFRPGERVRLRIVNASAMTTFDVRIPGLSMTVVQADGQNVRPVRVDEFQFGPAETYDVVVTLPEARAYTLVGESVDRSGLARMTLAPRPGMSAPVPPLRARPLADMGDMGMAMDAAHGAGTMPDMGGMTGMGAMSGMTGTGGVPHADPHGVAAPAGGGRGTAMRGMAMRDFANAPQVRRGPGVQTLSPMPLDRTGEPGQGLQQADHRVLTYRDLVALAPNPDVRAPARAIAVHLTGNMERYMWSFDGVKLSDGAAPIPLRVGERVRVTLVNDTMMAHPIHLHGHFFELVTGHGDHAPRKHTVLVQPGGTVSWDVTGNEGDWAFHCHMLYHMHAGMMRIVQVRRAEERAA